MSARKKGCDMRREEWDFEWLDDKDVYACHAWEYHRDLCLNNAELMDAVRRIRKGRRLNKDGLYGDPLEASDAAWFMDGYALYPSSIWPPKPFAEVEPDVRHKLKQLQAKVVIPPGQSYDLCVSQVPLQNPETIPGCSGYWTELLSGKLWNKISCHWDIPAAEASQRKVVVAFEIDLARPDTALKKSFGEWLKSVRGQGCFSPRPPIQTAAYWIKNQRADLKALGAKRLCEKMSTDDASDFSMKHSRNQKCLYEHASCWSDARDRAGRLLREMGRNQAEIARRLL